MPSLVSSAYISVFILLSRASLSGLKSVYVEMCNVPSECNTTLDSHLFPHTSNTPLPLTTPVGRPFVSTGVTCRHQLPIRQCNIRPILPACDWEILEWSKPTNLIYRASINKEIVPSLIALLNNGCLFGNHFPISHHFPLDWPSKDSSFFFQFLSFSLSLFFFFTVLSPLLYSLI